MLTAPTDDDDFDRDRKIFLGAFPGVKTFQTFDDDRERKDRLLAKVIHVSQNVTWNYISLADKYGLPFLLILMAVALIHSSKRVCPLVTARGQRRILIFHEK